MTGRARTGTWWNPTQYGGVRQDIQWRIGSYRNIYAQVTGPRKVTTFSPKTANQWTNYVNNGYRVYKFTTLQLTQVFGSQWDNTTAPTLATRWLRQKYGNHVKAVARGRSNCWLVATSGNINRGPFRNYTWK